MINVSTQLKKESLTNRNYYVTANVTLSDGTTLKLGKKDFYLSGNSLVDSADSGDFPVGVAIEKTASLSLVNDDGRFDNYNFNGARFVIFLNLQLSDKLETIKRGTYIVSKKPATASEISLSLLDRMHNADKSYDSNLSFPCTVKELLSECCQQCNITLGDATFPNADFQIQQAPSNATYRTVIGMCAGIAGGNARIDENDLLRIITFDKNFTNTSARSGDNSNGSDYHVLSSIQNLQYDVDDIIVTGVKYVEDETEYMSGQDGYVITIDNQLLSGNARTGIEAIGSQLIGLRMRPFSCDGIANGYATFGDSVEFTNVKKRTFKSFVTDLEFTFGGSTSWSCSAKSAEEDTSEFIGEQQVAVEQSKKDIEKKLSAYDVKLKQMNELAANTLGFFYTEEKQEDGSVITYRHDKPTLADSKVIYKTGVDGFFLSIDGGQTWKAGFDSNGDAVLNILYAIGIQSEWINTRGFTAKDNNGDVTLRVDADTGHVDIVANSFQLKGKTIQEIANESAKSYVDSVVIDGVDVSTQYFYAYDPTLENAPASEWTDADTKDKHLNDIFYNTSTKKMFRFVKIDSAYSWESFDNPDIKAALHAASTAQDTADGKRRVFLVTPRPPYDRGDMWVTSTTDGKGEIKICKTPRQSGAFSSAHWISPSYVDSDDVDNAISEYDTSLGQPEIFNKLTNNGKNKGIYIQDGELYINASYIKSGQISADLINLKNINVTNSSGTSTFAIDNYGNVTLRPNTFVLTNGDTIYSVAEDKASAALSNANQYTDNALSNLDIGKMSKQEIINVLSDNSSNKGLYLSNGNVYMNADYINTGELAGWIVDAANKTLKSYGTKHGGAVELNGEDGYIYAKSNLSYYISGYGTVYGTSIEGATIETGRIYAADLTTNKVDTSDISAGIIRVTNTITADGIIKSNSHIEARNNGHFYCDGTGTDLADASIRGDLTVAGVSRLNKSVQMKNIGTGSGTGLVLTPLSMTGGGFVFKKASSSKRYKKHLSFMEESDVKNLYDLRPVFFEYKEGYLMESDPDNKRKIPGFYAELVEKYFPDAVRYNEKGQVEDWDPKKLLPAVFELVRLQKQQLDSQQETINNLIGRIEKLEKES